MQSALDKQREAAEKALKAIGEQQAEIKVLPAHNRKTVSTDLAILSQRQMFTDALFGPDEKLRGLTLNLDPRPLPRKIPLRSLASQGLAAPRSW